MFIRSPSPEAKNSLARGSCVTAIHPSRAALAGLLLGAAAVTLAWSLPTTSVSRDGPEVSWLLLALLFGVAEVAVLHVQLGGGARTVSLSEAPLVLGLFFTAPPGLALARLVGPLIVFAIIRRQSVLKLGVNAAVLLLEAAVAVEVFRLVLDGAAPTSAYAWLAAYVAILVSGVGAAVLITVIIAIVQAEFSGRDLARALTRAVATSGAVSLVVGTIALVAVNALQRSAQTGWLLLGAAAVILVCYRAYAVLTGRHAALAKLYRFTDTVSSTHEPDDVLRQLLLSARELAGAEHAEIVFAPALPGAHPTRLTVDRSGHLCRTDASSPDGASGADHADPVHAHVLETGSALLLPHRAELSCRPEWRGYLKRSGRREVLAVPLRAARHPVVAGPAANAGADAVLPFGEDDWSAGDPPGSGPQPVTGSLLVAGRVGQVRTFDAADLRLVETIANHAGLALRNGWLINGLTHAVRHDALTGLVNRSFLHHQLSEVLGEIRSGTRSGAAVMICDLNGFKDVNDALGHQMGDVLLREVAVRASSALSPGDVLARLGGDEFAILLPNALTRAEAAETGKRVLAAIAEPVALADLVISVGMSIGVALAPRHGVEPSGLLKRADLAMYTAKATNRGLRIWESGMGQTDAQQLSFGGELRRALADGELTAFGQPVASLVSGEIVAVEVLARWQHPERGMLLPDEFLPIASSCGLVGELTRHLLAAAISSCAEWRGAGHALSVSVALPQRALGDPTLAPTLAGLLDEYALPPHRLTLEIAESSLMHERSRMLPSLGQLSALGVRVAMCGFGSGQSSLSYLRRMPVRQVNIDAGFVRRIGHDASDEAIVHSIIELGVRLGLDVVAEGVDEQPVWDQLRRMGCDQAQGALVCRPMPLPDIPGWLVRDDATTRRRLVRSPLGSGRPGEAVELRARDSLRGQAS
jgi:diguanylate cyclase (GGDEF)-like protein